MTVTLAPNPSHLEAVNPVIEGRARAEQTTRRGQEALHDGTVALPLLIHGDAAFAGQGVVAETFNLMRLKGYATGRPTGGPAAEVSWLYGIDLANVARSCHGVEAIGYVADPVRLELEVEAYRSAIGEETPFSVCLRPSPPDCDDAANLAEKVSRLHSLGVATIDFYHYGFLRLSALDWIRAALDATGERTGRGAGWS